MPCPNSFLKTNLIATLYRMMKIPEDDIITSRPDDPEHCNNYFHKEWPIDLSFEHGN
jgi:hypothetical protein